MQIDPAGIVHWAVSSGISGLNTGCLGFVESHSVSASNAIKYQSIDSEVWERAEEKYPCYVILFPSSKNVTKEPEEALFPPYVFSSMLLRAC